MKILVRILLALVCWVSAFIAGIIVRWIAAGLGYEMSIAEAMILAVVIALYDRYMADRS